jgi:chemotaxis protein histidine kinase CheA
MSKSKIVLKKLKALDKIWHPESTLVFKSLDDKKVIGRYTDNEFISLDETALQLCVDWSFTYDPDLVEEASDEEEKSTVDEVQEATDEEEKSTVDEVQEANDEEKSNVNEVQEANEVEETHDQQQNEVQEAKAINTHTSNATDKVEMVDTRVNDGFKNVIDSINSLYYSKVSAYNEVCIELSNTKSILNDVQNELINKNTELNELQTKFNNIKRAFLQ